MVKAYRYPEYLPVSRTRTNHALLSPASFLQNTLQPLLKTVHFPIPYDEEQESLTCCRSMGFQRVRQTERLNNTFIVIDTLLVFNFPTIKNTATGDFLVNPTAVTPCFQYRGHRFDCWSWN